MNQVRIPDWPCDENCLKHEFLLPWRETNPTICGIYLHLNFWWFLILRPRCQGKLKPKSNASSLEESGHTLAKPPRRQVSTIRRRGKVRSFKHSTGWDSAFLPFAGGYPACNLSCEVRPLQLLPLLTGVPTFEHCHVRLVGPYQIDYLSWFISQIP